MSPEPSNSGLPTTNFVELAYHQTTGRDHLKFLEKKLGRMIAALQDSELEPDGNIRIDAVLPGLKLIQEQLGKAVQMQTELGFCLNMVVELATTAYGLGLRYTKPE